MWNSQNAVAYADTIQTLAEAATITMDANLWSTWEVTLTANRIMGLPTNLTPGATYQIKVTQDGTWGHTLTYAAGWVLSVNPLRLNTWANEETIISFKVFSNWKPYAVSAVDFTEVI